MYTYKIEITMYNRKNNTYRWSKTDNVFDIVTEINGFANAQRTMQTELHKILDSCFASKGKTYLRDRRHYNTVGYVTNEKETTLYKLEVLRTH